MAVRAALPAADSTAAAAIEAPAALAAGIAPSAPRAALPAAAAATFLFLLLPLPYALPLLFSSSPRRRLRLRNGLALCGRRKGAGMRTAWRELLLLTVTGTTRRPLRSPRPRYVDVGLRRALEDPVKTSHHPLGVISIIVALVAIVLVRGIFLGLPLLPRFRTAFLERLSLEVLFLLFFLFQVLCGLLLLCGFAPPLTVDVVLLYRRLRGPSVDRSLCK